MLDICYMQSLWVTLTPPVLSVRYSFIIKQARQPIDYGSQEKDNGNKRQKRQYTNELSVALPPIAYIGVRLRTLTSSVIIAQSCC